MASPRAAELVGAGRRSSARPGCRSSPGPRGTGRASRRARPASPSPVGRRAPAGPAGSGRSRSARPTISPACGPPTSLSPLNVTRSAPASSRSRGVGSWASPNAAVSRNAPLPRSSTTIAPWRCASSARARGSGASTNPACVKLDGWTRRTTVARPSASGASKSAARVRFVVPTSMRRAPARRIISGIRTPPPISTSSPRETATPRLAGEPDREQQRRRVVDGDDRVLGAGERDQVCLGGPEPRPASPRVAVELEQGIAGGGAAGGLDGRRRPRRATEVRVEDHAGRVDDRRRGRPPDPSNASRRVRDRLGERPASAVGGSPAASAARSAGDDVAGGSGKCRGLELAPNPPARRTAASSRSTLGGRGRSDDIGPPWRERVGVEPTAPRRAPRHWF